MWTMCGVSALMLLHGVYSTVRAMSLKEVLRNNNSWEQSKDIHMYIHTQYMHTQTT